jgi:hypothetical protein
MKAKTLLLIAVLVTVCGTLNIYSNGHVAKFIEKPKYTDWSAPVNLGPVINSSANEVGPALSRDGRSLYFTSDRFGFGGEDIWVAHRRNPNDEWDAPINLGPVVNSSANDRLRYLSPNGHLMLIQSNRFPGFGGSDIWMTTRKGVDDDFGWDMPMNLGSIVNSPSNELGSAFLFGADGRNHELYFSSARIGGMGSADFYKSEILEDGTFSEPVNVVELNSFGNDSCLTFSSDGLEVFFTSTRPDITNAPNSNDLWTSTRATVSDLWSRPINVAGVNLPNSLDAHPFLSFDGKILIFTSNRGTGAGNDLFMSTRERGKVRGRGLLN